MTETMKNEMKQTDRMEENTVSAKGQVAEEVVRGSNEKGGAIKVLFVGNSITLHAPLAEIGWYGNWGMAASCQEKDYVHVAVRMLREKLGEVDFTFVNCAAWEREYWEDDQILERFREARDYQADVVVIRIGENSWGVRENFEGKPYAPHFLHMVRYFASNPKATVIVTDLFWPKEILNGQIYRAVEEGGYPLVTLGDLGVADENMAIGQYEHRGVSVHPNDLGMERIAQRVVDRILAELPSEK